MVKVTYDPKTQDYVHENGRRIPASDIRNLPHHRKEVLRMAGADPNIKPEAPIENETQHELAYVERILGDGIEE